MLRPEDLKIEMTEDRPSGGMWHNGPNPCWVSVTHLPTMISARAYERSAHKAKSSAMACVEMMLSNAANDQCHFPERLASPEFVLSDGAESGADAAEEG
jgi:protein subunit release factor A